MELFATEDSRPPAGGVVAAAIAADGVRLRFAHWPAIARRSVGTVCLLEGRGECIERYYETIGDLRSRGFAVAIFDWRGQGGSDRRLRNPRKGHVDSFAEYDRDLDAFVEQVVLPDCPPPYFALAHSTGALVCLRAAHDGRARFSRLVLAAPLLAFGPRPPRQPTVCRIAATMTALGLGEVSAHGRAQETLDRVPFEGNPLTGDPRRFQRNVAIYRGLRQISVGGPTYAWLNAACRAMRAAADPDFGRAIRVPTLAIVGALDSVVSLRAVESLAGELRAGGSMIIPGARHELLMERPAVREQFWAAFDAFVPGS
jgi:lysophospholipase